MQKKQHSKKPDGNLFSIKITDGMELRNLLRAGLFEAQGKNGDKIPLFVSWPPWLEDGIVCIYAKDLHALLSKTIRDTASSFSRLIDEQEEEIPEGDFPTEPVDPEVDEAREAARVILERPLVEVSDETEDVPPETTDEEPEGAGGESIESGDEPTEPG